MSEPTQIVCATCDWKPADARHNPWWSWLCQHENAKLEPWWNPVTGQTIADPPRRKCKDRNTAGTCPDWKEGANILAIKVPLNLK